MSWYAIYRSQFGAINGFIVDKNDIPIEYETEEEAEEKLKGHYLMISGYIDIIEL